MKRKKGSVIENVQRESEKLLAALDVLVDPELLLLLPVLPKLKELLLLLLLLEDEPHPPPTFQWRQSINNCGQIMNHRIGNILAPIA